MPLESELFIMEPTFEEIRNNIQNLYQRSEYKAALDLAAHNAARFPEHAPLFNYWKICFTASLGQIDESIRLLDDLLTSGFWYAESLLRTSPALSSLQSQPMFEALFEVNQHNYKADRVLNYPLLTIRPIGKCEVNNNPCPLLFALHGNASNAQGDLDFWKIASNEGWLLALPQSSQPLWKDAYIWDDLDISSEEVRRHFRSLLQRYAVDQNRIILAGHNMGGEVAIWLALSGVLPVSGFLAIAPNGPFMLDLKKWQPYIESIQSRLLHSEKTFIGEILIGEETKEEIIKSNSRFIQVLNDAGIPSKITFVSGAAENLSPEYTAKIANTLSLIP